ncbi:MAG: S46 family peptidase [Rhodothermales bacterium]
MTRLSVFLAALLWLAPPLLAQSPTDTVRAGQYDNGKMWTFDFPPLDYFEKTYGLTLDDEWLATARMGALRIPNCSASFVSPHGLVMTNHHCARESVSAVSRAGENLLDDGFYAQSLTDERPAAEMYAEQLIRIDDVTDEVLTALADAQTDAERADARTTAIDSITARIETAMGDAFTAEVIALYNGGRYSAYTFRRYDDVRLVMAPELQLGYYGGDADNFTYPRYNLDMTFFRVYNDEGDPLETEHYFAWNRDGAGDGELVFVVGNPGSTSRQQTVAQLEYRRDIGDRYVLDLIKSRVATLEAYYEAYPDEAESLDLRNSIFSLRNGEKAYTGQLEALHDPAIMARRRAFEREFKAAIASDADAQAKYGDLWDEMARLQTEQRSLAGPYGAFIGMESEDLTSATLRRALYATIYLLQKANGAPAEVLDGVREPLLEIGERPEALDVALLSARLIDWQTYLGAESPVVQQALGGRTPAEAAQAIVSGSVLSDSAGTRQVLENDELTLGDPAIVLMQAAIPAFIGFQQAYFGLIEQETNVAQQLGQAVFDAYGTLIPPDATFSLRLADGIVKGFDYNGTIAPPFTSFYGLYDHYYSYGEDSEWDLPERWLNPPSTFDYSTRMNLVTTADIIGGNSGSPLLNRNLEVVGLIFDGNIESLSSDFIYLPETSRSVAVDVRGMLEALDEIYDADRLVLELLTGDAVATEAEADAQMQ